MNAPSEKSSHAGNGITDEVMLHPEQYELSDAASRRAPWTRRTFLKTFGGGLAVLWLIDFNAPAQSESGQAGRGAGRGQRRPAELAAWLHIDANGIITAFTGKTEVGQNIRTSLTQAIAEELPAPLAAIRLVMADTRLVPWDAGTFGSRSTPDMNLQLRKVAATARQALIDLGARRLGVDGATLRAADGKILHEASGRTLGYGELTNGEKLVVNVSDDIALKPAEAWTVAGKSIAKVDGRNFVTGKHLYTTDIARPEMIHGRVLRPPSFGATLVSLDATAAEAMRDVTVVRDGNFVGVAAPTEHAAARAVAALRAEWKPVAQVSERELFAHLKSSGRNGPPPAEAGDVNIVRNTYQIAYIAHAPLEPRAAVAEWQGTQLTVWTGSQRPFGVRTELASALQVPEENVRVIIPDTGSGYGGKHTGDAAVEAARLARAAGRPVKLVWTREEEFTWAYFRPAGVIEISSQLRPDGTIASWEHHNYNSGNAGIRCLYEVGTKKEEFHRAESPLRQGSYRALAATANHFARESQVDELARSARVDPLQFRLNNLRDPRARAVLEAAATAFGWKQRTRRDGRGFGITFGFDKGGYLATCTEITIDRAKGSARIERVVQSFECGAIVNPDHLRNQIEGSIVQGLGGALFETVHFENGRILNPRFSNYRVPRFSDMPTIEIVLLDRKDLPSAGAGEAPIVGIAPAIANAVFDATGVRLRNLPLLPHGFTVSAPPAGAGG